MNERVRPLLVQDGCTRRSSRLFYGIDDPGFAVHTINDCQEPKTEDKENERSIVRAAIVSRLDAIIDIDGNRPCDPRDISADHQHHAEFAHRMGKAQSSARNDAGNRDG